MLRSVDAASTTGAIRIATKKDARKDIRAFYPAAQPPARIPAFSAARA
jgi:hypothetical protein